jgi:hypothetical protein
MLPADLQNKDLNDMLPSRGIYHERTLACHEQRRRLRKEKKRNCSKMARYSGMSEKVILQNIDVPTGYFWKELLRDQGFTVGRLDSRYKGIDKKRCW